MRCAAAACALLALAGCSKGEAEVRPAFQVVAKVNEQAIQANELQSVMAQDGSLLMGGSDAHAAALERLIDQELMVQRARERKLDRDPRVQHSIEAAQREILARAYLEQITSQSPPPTEDEIAEFYAGNPELFAKRRIYSLQELDIQVTASRFDEIRQLAARAGSLQEVTDWLVQHQVPFRLGNAVKPAEQLPLETLKGFAAMKDGQMLLSRTETGALLVHLATSRLQPVDKASARPMIERYLSNMHKVALAKAELERLRDTAHIEYVDPADTAPPPAPVAGVAPASAGPGGAAVPGVAASMRPVP